MRMMKKRMRWPFTREVVVITASAREAELDVHKMLKCSRTERIEKNIHVLCGETLFLVRLIAQNREFDGHMDLTCEVVSIDFEPSNPQDTSRTVGFDRESPSDEEIFNLIAKTIGETVGITIERIVPVSDRYVESHRRLVDLKKRIVKGGVTQ